jgi:hypothetical protein
MVTVSQKEFQRVKVIENAVDGRLSVSEAAGLLQLSERQVQRLKRRYRPDSVAWVHHGNRGRPMPWALPAGAAATLEDIRAEVLTPDRLNSLVFGVFAAVALAISCSGH